MHFLYQLTQVCEQARQHAGVTTVSSCLCGRDSDIEPLVHLPRTNKWGGKKKTLLKC